MREYPVVTRILMLIGCFLVAGLAIRLVGFIFSGLLGLFFKFIIPLALAYWFVQWLTKKRLR